MFNKYILDNPEILRHLRTNFRYPRFLSFVILFLLSVLSLYALIYFIMGDSSKFNFATYCRVIYATTIGIDYMFFYYIGTYLISNSLSQEKEKGTFDFIRLSLIEKKVIAIGKLLGAPVFLTFLILLTFPFVIASAFFANIDPLHFLIAHFNLVIYGLLFHTLGLFCAVSMPKSTSANSLALILPLLITTSTLSMSGRMANPFYTLFSSLGNTPFRINNINFFGYPFPDFLVMGIIILYLVSWLLVGLTRKLESETNHTLNKMQAVWFTVGTELIIIGTQWNYLIEGNTFSIIQFYVMNLILLVILIAILSPTREDIFIYLNKPKAFQNIWDPKSPIFILIFFLNIIIMGFAILTASAAIFINKLPQHLIHFTFLLSLLLFLFSFIYSQIFYLSSIAFIKNSASITSLIISLTLFIPIPLNFLTKNKEDFFDLFIFNPFVAFAKLRVEDFLNLANISQLTLLVIVVLALNVFVLSKQEEINKKYRI